MSRRSVLRGALGVVGVAWLPGLGLAACTSPEAGAPVPTGSTPPPTTGAGGSTATRVLYRNGALTDARSATVQRGQSVLVEGGRVSWIRPKDAEAETGSADDLWVVDCGGSTILPGLVDAHAHTSMTGGLAFVDSAKAPVASQLRHGDENARLLTAAGIRYLRDVGSPRVADPDTGQERAASLVLRDRWKDRPGYPVVRAAGTWLQRAPAAGLQGVTLQVTDSAQLLAAATQQLDEGADLLKIYLETTGTSSPWTAAEMTPVVALAHERGKKVAAHAAVADAIQQAVAAGVDSVEHGNEMPAVAIQTAARQGTVLVPTLAAGRAGARAIALDTGASIQEYVDAVVQPAAATAKQAAAAGVALVTGSDFGGCPMHAGLLYEEVELLVSAVGLEPWEALAAATWRGGELMGVPDAGVLREGGPADLVVVEGDPLSDPTALRRVWHVSWQV